MVTLDSNLIAKAQEVAGSANVHRIGTWVFLYQVSVLKHNSGDPEHRIYDKQFELLLRQFVREAILSRAIVAEMQSFVEADGESRRRTLRAMETLQKYKTAKDRRSVRG
jgi:hypothetical protein